MVFGKKYEIILEGVQKVELSYLESFFLGLDSVDADETTTSRMQSGRIYDFDLKLSYAIVRGFCQRSGDVFSGKITFQVRKDLEGRVLLELPGIVPAVKDSIFLIE